MLFMAFLNDRNLSGTDVGRVVTDVVRCVLIYWCKDTNTKTVKAYINIIMYILRTSLY